MEYLWLLLGFVLLIKGADFFVDGSSSVAKLLKVPSIIIGLTVVAFGTSMPEASVSITAALQGQNNLAISNVLGSNIFNLLIVLGASAIMSPVVANKDVIRKEFPFSIMITGVLALLSTKLNVAGLADRGTTYELGRVSGLILLALFIFFVAWQVKGALKAREEDEGEAVETLSPLKSAIYILGGLVGIIWGGDLVVDAATIIAQNLGFTETFIGLTVVALGTSLPELVTSVVAAKKGENDLALGNVIGSNIFNILLILGASATICPVAVEAVAIYDMLVLIVVSIIGYFLAKSKYELSKKEGMIMIAMYVAYFFYIYFR